MPVERGQRLPHRAAAAPRPDAARDRARLRELHRAAARHARVRARSRSRSCARACAPASRCRGRCSTASTRSIRAHVVDDPARSVFHAPFDAIPAGRRRSRTASACARRGRGGGARGRGRRVPRAAGVLREGVPARRAGHHRRLGPAPRPRVLRLPGEELHDPRRDAGRGPSPRPVRGRADPGRDGRRDAEDGVRGRLPRLPRLPAHATRASTRRRRRSCSRHASRIAKRIDGKLPALFATPAAAAVRRGAGARAHRAEVHRRPLRRAAAGRDARGDLLGQHARAGEPAPVRAGGADPARGRARPPPPDRPAAGDDRRAALPPRVGHRRLRRGLGALRRAARPRGRHLRGPVRRLRPPHLRDVAGLPAGGRHRHPRHGLDARAGHRLHGRATPRSRCTR